MESEKEEQIEDGKIESGMEEIKSPEREETSEEEFQEKYLSSSERRPTHAKAK